MFSSKSPLRLRATGEADRDMTTVWESKKGGAKRLTGGKLPKTKGVSMEV